MQHNSSIGINIGGKNWKKMHLNLDIVNSLSGRA